MRQEIEAYGELLNLIRAQQETILERQTEQLEFLTAEIDAKLEASRSLTLKREFITLSIAKEKGSKKRRLSELLDCFDPNVRPLLQALIAEIRALSIRTKEKSQQNQMILMRACELSESLLQKFLPEKSPMTYSPTGKIKTFSKTLYATG
ncbi:MAG: hypothetical protein A2Y14_04770 [Verrucomicrobia bacterium GWF2_51_19]|nr:MAG: hypothetical protein A2Y14_04770 [Verrucomicrobia bacterium GWF2_51_19]